MRPRARTIGRALPVHGWTYLPPVQNGGDLSTHGGPRSRKWAVMTWCRRGLVPTLHTHASRTHLGTHACRWSCVPACLAYPHGLPFTWLHTCVLAFTGARLPMPAICTLGPRTETQGSGDALNQASQLSSAPIALAHACHTWGRGNIQARYETVATEHMQAEVHPQCVENPRYTSIALSVRVLCGLQGAGFWGFGVGA